MMKRYDLIERVRGMESWQEMKETPDGDYVKVEDICELALCESIHLGLRPNMLYRFTVSPSCPECVRLEKENALPPPRVIDNAIAP